MQESKNKKNSQPKLNGFFFPKDSRPVDVIKSG